MPRAWNIGRRAAGLSSALILLSVSLLPAPQAAESTGLKVGAGAEYLNRTISWDEQAYTSSLRGYLFSLQADYEVRPGLSVLFRGGYALSSFNGLVFRELPFSVEYQAGFTGGLYLGGGFKAHAPAAEVFYLEFEALFDTCFGFGGQWALEGLAVPGALEGRSSWSRISVGPSVWYKGLAYYVYPFVQVRYTSLWGSFTMTETVDVLEGTEIKSVKGSGAVAVSIGVLSEVTEVLSLRAEATAVPRSGGLDLGASVRLAFSF
ncbi:MAG: hypothetical protein FJY83_07740 [Candidatus Aminicenantes bacterium]|nr:hypothetical protein [Candidatus Aminicenantes bacterium]